MDQIKKKMNSWKYESLDEYIEDFKLLFNNARTFNDETSVVYKDADSMQVREFCFFSLSHTKLTMTCTTGCL